MGKKQVFRLREDGMFDFTDSIVVDENEIPEGYTVPDPAKRYKSDGTEMTNAELLEQSKEQKLSEIKSAYKQALTGGVTSSLVVNGENVVFPYTEIDQLNYSKRANTLALDSTITEFQLGTRSHGVITTTRDQFVQFMNDADNHEMSLYMKRKQLEAQVEVATTVSEVDSVAW